MFLIGPQRRDDERGATLVEFAIVFPLLLLLIFGVVDFGRLIASFVSVSTASREGARYGTATGDGTVAGQPQYVDCTGIKDAAMAKIMFGGVTASDITVFWDEGPSDANPDFACDGYLGLSEPTANDIVSGYRVVVTVETQFEALTPIISPFIGTLDLESTDKRTIFKGVLGA